MGDETIFRIVGLEPHQALIACLLIAVVALAWAARMLYRERIKAMEQHLDDLKDTAAFSAEVASATQPSFQRTWRNQKAIAKAVDADLPDE